MEHRYSLQQMALEKLNIHMEKNECRHRPCTLHEINLKGVILRVKHKFIKHKIIELKCSLCKRKKTEK